MDPDQTAPCQDLGPYCLQYRLLKCIYKAEKWADGIYREWQEKGKGTSTAADYKI